MAKPAKKKRAGRKVPSPPSPPPPPPRSVRLPQEMMDSIIDFLLQEYDDDELLRTQVKLRCLGRSRDGQDQEKPMRKKKAGLIVDADTTALLTLSQICHSLRPRVLRYLWKTVRLDTVHEVDLISSLLATAGGVQAYGHHVRRVDFVWTCKTPVRPVRDSLSRYRWQVQPTMTLAQSAFARRTAKYAAALEFKPELKPTWYTNTDGPDGRGEVAGIKTPKDLEHVLIDFFMRLPRLHTLTWDGTVLPLSTALVTAIDLRTGGNLKNFGFIMRINSGNASDFENCKTAGIQTLHVPGLHSGLEHLHISNGSDPRGQMHIPEYLFPFDNNKPFGVSTWENVGTSRFGAPCPRWIVNTCIKGALKGLKAVTLSSDHMLQYRKLWPLWLFLEVHIDERDCEHIWDGEQHRCKHAKGGYGRIQADALGVVRSAIQQFDGTKEGDWLEAVLQALSVDVKEEIALLKTRLWPTEASVASNKIETIGNGPDRADVHRRYMALLSAKTIVAALLADHLLRHRVAKCWQEQDENSLSESDYDSDETL